jgi:hypothetical protein
VRLGINSALKLHDFSAASNSAAASRPFKNRPTVRGVNSGAESSNSLLSDANARAVTTSGPAKLA